jgi:hypothetical protein
VARADARLQAAEAGEEILTRKLAKLSNISALDDDRRTSVELASKSQVLQGLAEPGLDPTPEACGQAFANAFRKQLDLSSAISGLMAIGALLQAAEAGEEILTRKLTKLSNVNAVGDDQKPSVKLANKSQVIQALAEHGLDPTSEACGRALANACRDTSLIC